jgi:excisionase family DNA binding protein
MHDLLSPKQVAQALQVSESSVKRWCDKGSIHTTYTDGGHRRIRLVDLAGFVRTNSLTIRDYSPIGMVQQNREADDLQSDAEAMTDALLAGDESRCYQIAIELFLAKRKIFEICDEVLARAFHKIGDRWACGQAEIYQERRGCRIAQRILARLQAAVLDPKPDAPLALGCSTTGDHYSLGSTMAELVLRDAGWRAAALGEGLPLASLGAAIKNHSPKIVWISCGYIDNLSEFIADYQLLFREYSAEVSFVVGGRALTPELLSNLSFSSHCKSMRDLYSFSLSVFDQSGTNN